MSFKHALGIMGTVAGPALTTPILAESPVIALSNSFYGNSWRE